MTQTESNHCSQQKGMTFLEVTPFSLSVKLHDRWRARRVLSQARLWAASYTSPQFCRSLL